MPTGNCPEYLSLFRLGDNQIRVGANERRRSARRNTRCGDLAKDRPLGEISDAHRDRDRRHQNKLSYVNANSPNAAEWSPLSFYGNCSAAIFKTPMPTIFRPVRA